VLRDVRIVAHPGERELRRRFQSQQAILLHETLVIMERVTAETLLQYRKPVIGPDGSVYEARACGRPMERRMSGGMWEGWIEFMPIEGGMLLRTPRETTQPNRADAEYWATGLTPVYLEGALRRARDSQSRW
jgi:hypothetical protein